MTARPRTTGETEPRRKNMAKLIPFTAFATIALACGGPSRTTTTGPTSSPSGSSTPTIECAIVPSNCTCAWECQQVWNGVPGATCASACEKFDDPAKREPPPKRPCGPKKGVCAFLDE